MKCSGIAGGFTGWHWNHEIGSLLVAKWNGLRNSNSPANCFALLAIFDSYDVVTLRFSSGKFP